MAGSGPKAANPAEPRFDEIHVPPGRAVHASLATLPVHEGVLRVLPAKNPISPGCGNYEGSPKHGKADRGRANKAPENGQAALDNSAQASPNSPRRVGVDKDQAQKNARRFLRCPHRGPPPAARRSAYTRSRGERTRRHRDVRLGGMTPDGLRLAGAALDWLVSSRPAEDVALARYGLAWRASLDTEVGRRHARHRAAGGGRGVPENVVTGSGEVVSLRGCTSHPRDP